ncbi:MAG: DUF2283 domain-containing protein [Candidatus Eremiobacteraeota bacterium]|nr:DUF2283 domain-containing protein [Candidatus Eremiobacteraeota bacterium]
MLRELKNVEAGEHATYFRFSKMPVAKTRCLANGEINVDLDADNEVVGIEVLSLDPEEMQTLADVVKEYRLSLSQLTHALKPSA